MLKRREFFSLVARAGAALPLAFAPWGCAPAITASDPETGLSLGYTAGDVTSDSSIIWLRADPGSLVTLHYGTDPTLRDDLISAPLSVAAASDYTACFELTRLAPATTYYYYAAVANKKPGPLARFKTAPRPDDLTKVTFCFSGDTRESYKPFTVMDAVRAQQPDFFLHLGDTIYADRGATAHRLEEFWAKYRANRDDAATKRCFSETSCYVVWDDHEVADDFSPDDALAPVGRRAFLDYWPIRHDPKEPQRVYRSFRWGKTLELFILDTRQYRDRARETMLGGAQKRWLLDGLAASPALFKFIATSVPVSGGGKDRWDGFPKERAEIIQFIAARNLKGVVFLSADLHYAAITKIPKGHGLKDITAGPLAAPLNRVTDWSAKRFEYFLAQNFNFAKITVDPSQSPHYALVEFIDQDNVLFHSAKIYA